jgi:hypothetical protein
VLPVLRHPGLGYIRRGDTTMKTIQELVTSLLPQKWAEDIEADSRAWMMQCTFGNKVSV